jgi:hypothetical protein
MGFGGTPHEILQLNEDTLWSGKAAGLEQILTQRRFSPSSEWLSLKPPITTRPIGNAEPV